MGHRPLTQEGKRTGTTYLTYFPRMSAKTHCKQAGTNLKIQITLRHAAKLKIEGQFLLKITLELCLQKPEEKWFDL